MSEFDANFGMSKGVRAVLDTHAKMESGLERMQASQMTSKQVVDGLISHTRREKNPVLDIFDDIAKAVEEFQASLDAEHEVGIYVAGSTSLVHIRTIDRRLPSLLVFEGLDGEQRKTVAIQHIAQLNLQLVAVHKLADQAYRIGFVNHD